MTIALLAVVFLAVACNAGCRSAQLPAKAKTTTGATQSRVEAVRLLIELVLLDNVLYDTRAEESLEKLGDDEVPQEIIATLRTGRPGSRDRLVHILSYYLDRQTIEFLSELFKTETETKVRIQVLETASHGLNDSTLKPLIMKMLKEGALDDNAHIRGEAAYAIGKSGDKENVDFLKERLRLEKDEYAARSFKIGLCFLGDATYLSEISSVALKPDSHDEYWLTIRAIRALGANGSKQAVRSLFKIMEDLGFPEIGTEHYISTEELIYLEVIKALHRATGQVLAQGPKWKEWWEKNKSLYEE